MIPTRVNRNTQTHHIDRGGGIGDLYVKKKPNVNKQKLKKIYILIERFSFLSFYSFMFV